MTFDGTGCSVFELKRDIIKVSGLGDGTDFDLAVYSIDNNEGRCKTSCFDMFIKLILSEYDDDTAIISRGTTVIARRLPAAKPGAGRAARYVSGKMPVAAKNQHRVEASRPVAAKSTPVASISADNKEMTEEEKIAATLQDQDAQWGQTQQHMAKYVYHHKTPAWIHY